MPVPLPTQVDVDLRRPDAEEVALISRGVVSAVVPSGGLTSMQQLLIAAVFHSMTGHPADLAPEPIDAGAFARGLARRNAAFRTRIVQIMVLNALILRPLPPDVATRVEQFARALSVKEGMLAVAQRFATGSLGLAAFDFERNGYTNTWSAADATALHTSTELASAWEQVVDDPALADR
jgi:hypothetical protein